ncbi:hypothetical protein RD110_12975 [Rhodoferax koreense]|uniref:Uncharacterized protein n=1 Tax=Rhodoferax koreensis TaxID=1842727 RepID=A0A1P8JW64_9BURK|nr:restriction endonuclease [Rhodoferax koreense]APW37994.1 hypothetical protein RD110_12975 [Rhodoferax koreense]
MADKFQSLDIAAPPLVIIADGDTPAAQGNARGHLFERFIARVFEAYGYEAPSRASMNVRSNGYELDISTKTTLSGEPAIAECKAYSSPLAITALKAFYGQLCTERLESPTTKGWFVAIPGMTGDGHQLAKKLETKDSGFRLLTAVEVYELVKQKGWADPIKAEASPISDQGLLLTAAGICAIAKELDADTRLPTRILVRRAHGAISETEKSLLAASDYAGALPVFDVSATTVPAAVNRTHVEAPTLVTVVGSTEDFEYQFPAAPQFFVGREALLRDVQGVTKFDGTGQVIVLNAQSGWGKSSLALRIADQVRKAGGAALVFDTRTASSFSYVAAALQRATMVAVNDGLLTLQPNFSFASLQSAIQTLELASWKTPAAPLLIFFDQFENVFRDPRLTLEFRDLALSVRELSAPVSIGFSWKTDLVSLTENYPYRLRDEIRGTALVLNVEPFGPNEVGTLLGRLAKAAGAKLSLDLRQRIREYSQGLPWLLKKLASHILAQLKAGTSEEELLADSLNVERLFEQDIMALEASELDALKAIAREAPVAVVDVVERVSADMIQSLVDRRLLVRVGERLDIYWDTFREFLITGKIAVEDTYILRARPASTARLMQLVVANGGELATSDAVKALKTSQNVVFNISRELRQLGVLSPRQGMLVLVEQLRAPINEAKLQERVARSLKRHRLFGVVQQLLQSSTVSIDDFAAKLPPVFPAIEATEKTWRTYADAFAHWLDYAGLIHMRGQLLCPPSAGSKMRLLDEDGRNRRRTFPQGSPDIAIKYLQDQAVGLPSLPESSQSKAISDLQVLGVIREDLTVKDLECHAALTAGQPQVIELIPLLRSLPAVAAALARLEIEPTMRAEAVGALLREGYGATWAPATVSMAGTKFRAWARVAGLTVAKTSRKE